MRTYHTDKRPVICVTVGDPRGIGPEITRKALNSRSLKRKADFIILGIEHFSPSSRSKARREIDGARYAIGSIDTAVRLILNNEADALVTGPVCKEAINKCGVKFEGHTEYLSQLCNTPKIAMMFTSGKLKISLVTRHVAVKDVSRLLSFDKIFSTAQLTYEAMQKWFGIRNPRVAVCGLNPHCGEGGLFGDEEKKVIAPAVKALKKKFGGCAGPIPADSMMYDLYRGAYDAGICMYHDQGLAAFKMVARETGVNITLGLPFIRTSVDHGTGFDIAGKGIADPGSMIEAIKLGIHLVKTKKKTGV